MTRLEWYRLLRSGLKPMESRFAWTQALIYQGKTKDDVFALCIGDPREWITRLTVANYMRGAWSDTTRAHPFMKMMERKHSAPGEK